MQLGSKHSTVLQLGTWEKVRHAQGLHCTFLLQDEGWKPSISLKQILLGIQVRVLGGVMLDLHG